MLVEIHIIQNHAPSNLNRDDSGSPKECVFGGYKRARISSQCLKRSIRTSAIFQEALKDHLANRTRQLPELVRQALAKHGLPEDACNVAARKVSGFGTKAGDERAPVKDRYDTAQTMFVSKADVEAVAQVFLAVWNKSEKLKDIESLKPTDLQTSSEVNGYRPITVDIALFGRMTTSAAFRDVDGCAQVSHAISTHKVDQEYDYFTAVDDLQGAAADDDAGADMIGDVEFNSACYYKYFSIDFNGLMDNLTGASNGRKPTNSDIAAARTIAVSALNAFLKAAVMVAPSGKQNTFAAHQLPALLLVEIRPTPTPTSYANAFVKPAHQSYDRDLVRTSMEMFKEHVAALTTGFDLKSVDRILLAPAESDFVMDGSVKKLPSLSAVSARLTEVLANDKADTAS